MKFAADENFVGFVVRRLKNQVPNLDIVRAQDTSMYSQPDELLLEWAANENRILLTRDVSTIPPVAYKRIEEGKPLPGVFVMPEFVSLIEVADDLMMILTISDENEWRDKVTFSPL
jgi:hypothetical protein